MSDAPSIRRPIPTKRRWRRRVFWVLVTLLVLAAPPLGYFFYDRWQADRDLQEAIVALDRIDPGWRLEDIEAKRRQVPDEKNSAKIIVAAHAALPAKWGDLDFEDELAKVPPPVLLSAAQQEKLRQILQPL